MSDLHPPELLPDFEPVVNRLLLAVRRCETVLVWGHEDLDGMTATVVLRRAIADLGGRVISHIPDKVKDSHGLSTAAALRFLKYGVGLIVTVDCGVSNREAIAELAEQGLDVIVTDHHEVPDDLPPALANVDLKRPDSVYPYRGLAGVGVAFKLAMGLYRRLLGLDARDFLSVQRDLLALTVLGTLADRVPLTGEDRTLVAVGMHSLKQTSMPAVRAVLDRIDCPRYLTASRFVTDLLSLFASVGGNEGVERMLGSTPTESREWVRVLVERSIVWREDAEATYQTARGLAVLGDGVVFARSRGFSLRALGFCATRLKEHFRLPAVVMGWRGDCWVGECRGSAGWI